MSHEAWDQLAKSFDEEPDHGLAAPATREAWRRLMRSVMPPPPSRVADLGCGTGTLTGLLTDEGYLVDGVDFSPAMIQIARAKVPAARFVVADADDPPLVTASYDVVLSRHVLWAMPDPRAAFARWVRLLNPPGVIVLVEGLWATGAGMTSVETEQIARTFCAEVSVRPLRDQVYWGKPITDDRYLVVCRVADESAL